MVIDRSVQSLFASQVPLGRLNRDVPEQKLDLVQFLWSAEKCSARFCGRFHHAATVWGA